MADSWQPPERPDEPSQAEPAAPASDRLRRLGRLVRKELLEILRDRRTILTLVLMPVLLYPLLTIAFQQFMLANRLNMERPTAYRIAIPENMPKDMEFNIRKLLVDGDNLLTKGRRMGRDRVASSEMFFDIKPSSALEKEVREGLFHLALRLRKSWKENDFSRFDLVYHESSQASRAALDFVEQRLAAVNAFQLQQRLLQHPEPFFPLVRTYRAPMVDPKPSGLVSLTALVPLILILMTITGAVYPAIDLTAGERERGTLEILVAAPVPRLGLLFAKYVSVVTVAVLTALINLLMMFVTLVLSPVGQQIFGASGFSVVLFAQMFGLLLLFAAFFSAVLLSLTSFARSFKEAQAYLIPLMLLALAPGLIGMLPGIQLEGFLTVVPLLNIVLMGRDLFEGQPVGGVALIVVVTTALYAVAAIALAARIFGSEAVLYNEQSTWGDLFRLPEESRPAPTVTSALLCLAFMFPLWLLMQSLAVWFDFSSMIRMAVVPLFSILLFFGLPMMAALRGRVHLDTGFQVLRVSPLAVLGGMLMGVSLWPVVLQLLEYFKSGSLRLQEFEQIMGAMAEIRQAPLVWKLIVIVTPALVEELFFRGYLFSALKARTRPLETIVLSALAFGFFHVVTEAFGFERFLPSTLLGLILGWVCWRSGSVIPCMILHGLHNAILMMFGQSGMSMPVHVAAAGAAGGSLTIDEPTLPVSWVLAGAAGAAVGAALIYWSGRKAASSLPQQQPHDPSGQTAPVRV